MAEGVMDDWGLLIIVFLVGLGAFGLGRLSALEVVRPPVSIQNSEVLSHPKGTYMGGLYVASSAGKNYYFPWCPGASKISSDTAVWFQSESDAQAAGYTPGKNCKGLGIGSSK